MLRIPLWAQIFIAMVLGIVVGSILGDGVVINEVLRPLGTMFINLIKMLVVPLVFCSLVMGMVSMEGDFARMGRVGTRTFVLYIITTALAVMIGLFFATLMSPGEGLKGVDIPEVQGATEDSSQSILAMFMQTIVALVPDNPVGAFATANVLQIIVFAVLFGVAINLAGEKARIVRNFFEGAAEVMFKLTALVMHVAPIGVFALMSWVAGTYGLKVLKPLLMVIITAYVATAFHALFVIGSMVKVFGKLSPLRFFKAVSEPFSFAFVSTSSSGTLPLSLAAVNNNLGVSPRISNFVLPLGATINMDGTAIYQGVCAIFIAQAYGIDLTLSHYVTIVFTATLASIGTAGIPGAGLIMLSMVLASVGLPLEGLAIVAGIDRILDMARTSVNILGDCMCAVVVARKEGEIQLPDEEKKASA